MFFITKKKKKWYLQKQKELLSLHIEKLILNICLKLQVIDLQPYLRYAMIAPIQYGFKTLMKTL